MRTLFLNIGLSLVICFSFLGSMIAVEVVENLEYAKVGEKSLLLDVYPTTPVEGEKSPCAIWIHGGGWYSGSKRSPSILPLVTKGYVVVSINYRLTREAPFPAQIYDCKAAVRWVRANAATYDIDPDRIAVVGFSAGGHLAALIGTSGDVAELEGTEGTLGVSSQVQAVVDGYGPSDFETMWPIILSNPSVAEPGGLNNVDAVKALFKSKSKKEIISLAELASPVNYIEAGLPPFYIFHGSEDATVPVQQSQELNDLLKAQGNDVTLDIIQGQGHGVQGPMVAMKIAEFLDLKMKSTAISLTSSP